MVSVLGGFGGSDNNHAVVGFQRLGLSVPHPKKNFSQLSMYPTQGRQAQLPGPYHQVNYASCFHIVIYFPLPPREHHLLQTTHLPSHIERTRLLSYI